MAHEVEQMFSLEKTPWHGRGTIVDHALTADEAIVAAGLDWEVGLHPVFVGGVELDNKFATIREDTGMVLDIVGSRYYPLQNREIFSFFDPIVAKEDAAFYHTGGSLQDGRKVWLLAKVPGDFYVPGVRDDAIKNFVLLTNSHDGSMPMTAMHTPVRVVCMNTLRMALGHRGTRVSIRHTASAKQQLMEAHKVIGLATMRSKQLQEAAEVLVREQVGGRLLTNMLKRIFPSIPEQAGEEPSTQAVRHREAVEILFTTDDTNLLKGMKHTGWGAYNAVAQYADHQMPARKSTDKLHRMWFGSGATLKDKAFRFLMEQFDA